MRGKQSKRREIKPDAKYNSVILARFINCVMVGGKKTVAQKIVYTALDKMSETLKKEPIKAFEEIIRTVAPQVEVRSRRVGGANYQVPVEVSARRQITLSVRWLIDAARKRNERTMRERVAKELMDAANKEGAAYRKREDVYRMAEANRAYSHYRW